MPTRPLNKGVNPGGFRGSSRRAVHEAYDRFKEDFYKHYGGALNAGKFIFLEEWRKGATCHAGS